MRSALVLLVTTAAVALAGCGSSGGPAQTTTSSASTPASVPAATSTGSSTPASSATATTPASTTTSGPTSALCRAADLSASFLGGQAATGHGLLGFALRNVSTHTCTTFGYPGVQFLTRAGSPLPTVPTHTTQDFFGTLPNHPLAVSPGSTVSFRLGVTHGAASTAGCTTAWALQVIPPNDTSTLRVPVPEGAYECQTATVSPMQPGTSAYP